MAIDSVIEKFKESYLSADWKSAQEILIKNKDLFDRGIFHYNLGTVLYKEGDFPAARFHFEKAKINGYFTSETNHNLFAVKEKLKTEVYEKPVNSEGRLYYELNAIPGDLYITMTLLCLICLFSLRKYVQKYFFLILFLLSFTPVVVKYYYQDRIQPAIALKELEVFEGPSEIFSQSNTVPAGIKVMIGKEKDSWYYIEYPLQYSGWIQRQKLGIL